MLKIPGLKKKKKGKKKKDQELFTEEELEQYKQEQARKAAEAAEAAAAAEKVAAEEGSTGEQTNDEEWSRFAALTTGIDSVLKKTQDDLDRIKTTSFFQRVAPKIEETKDSEPEEDEETKKEKQVEALKNAVVELSESEYDESDEDMSVFDADYIEKVDLPLAYIPDSPTLEEQDGDDPFDTAYAEKVIKGPEVSKSGKKIVNIGAAALVLTGAVDNVPKSTVVKRPKRRGIKNLMLSSFDAENPDDPEEGEGEEKTEPKHNQLDDLFELPPEEAENVEIDLTVSLHMKYQEHKKEEEDEAEHKENGEENIDVLKEFDTLNEEDDEFAQLAAESLHKPAEVIQVVEAIPIIEAKPPESTDWAEFEQTDEPALKGIETELEIETPVDDDDPFNTAFVEAVLPKVDSFEELARESLQKPQKHVSIEEPVLTPPPTEINLLENVNPTISITESSGTREELARRKSSLSLSINPSKVVQFAVPTPDPMKSDIEFSTLIKKPLTPYYPKEDSLEKEEENVDPFDTSFVPNVQPSQLELNYIEQEMLKNLEDNDFDPRAVTPEPKPIIPPKPAPVVAQEPEQPKQPEDPFGNAIFDDDKYSALAVIDGSNKPVTELESDQLDILTTTLAEASVDVKVLTPQINPADSFEMADIDPFDTTFAENIRPGEAELKLIESELIQ